MSQVRTVATPQGDARLLVDRARRPVATLVLGHGAGGGPESPDLAALAAALPGEGISVFRVEQPWRVAGRRVAPRPERLDEALVAVVDGLRPRTPLVLGGRSAGARSAARTARHLGASGVLALSFPLHPPGRPERSRLPELTGAGVPAVVVQGAADPFGRPAEFPADVRVVPVAFADHALKVPRRAALSQEDALAVVVAASTAFVLEEVLGRPRAAGGNRRPGAGVGAEES